MVEVGHQLSSSVSYRAGASQGALRIAL